eukprot:5700943-Karenia_brevis.AAC.1
MDVEGDHDVEEVWLRRHRKRMEAVRAIKDCREYDPSDLWRPATPDPFDREVSKRQWESSVMQWRKCL